LICPTGSWKGWYFSEELKNARDKFGYTITPIEGYRFESDIIFKDYVDHFYEIKKNSEGAMKQISKLFLNSLYGRFGMSPILENTTITESKIASDSLRPDIDINRQYAIGDDTRLNISVAIAAAITAYSRMIINNFKNLPDNEVYYSDTDSVVLSKPLPDSMINKDLGGMKLEYKVKRGVFA
jgi:DNA polymerase elongation subunit (family B)